MADPLVPASTTSPTRELRRLGKNINGYFGDTIDIDEILKDCIAAAVAHRWTIEEVPVPDKPSLLAFSRQAEMPLPGTILPPQATGHQPRAIYLSTGIHGDEPAGPLAARQLLQEDRWPANLTLWLCPCLNPMGFMLNRRENAAGADLNRQYLQPKAEETKAHIAWLERQPSFDLCLCLHEDWEAHGFYLYELNPDGLPSLAEKIITRVAEVCPIDRSEIIEGRPARDGIIRPGVDPRSRPQWPEAFFLLTYKTRLSYTLEAPSDFPLATRVAALVTAVNTALATA
jgi:protein MpaA